MTISEWWWDQLIHDDVYGIWLCVLASERRTCIMFSIHSPELFQYSPLGEPKRTGSKPFMPVSATVLPFITVPSGSLAVLLKSRPVM